jgi:hypothetical protein
MNKQRRFVLISFDATICCLKALIKEVARIISRAVYGNYAHNFDYNSRSAEFNSTHTSLLTEGFISKL